MDAPARRLNLAETMRLKRLEIEKAKKEQQGARREDEEEDKGRRGHGEVRQENRGDARRDEEEVRHVEDDDDGRAEQRRGEEEEGSGHGEVLDVAQQVAPLSSPLSAPPPSAAASSRDTPALAALRLADRLRRENRKIREDQEARERDEQLKAWGLVRFAEAEPKVAEFMQRAVAMSPADDGKVIKVERRLRWELAEHWGLVEVTKKNPKQVAREVEEEGQSQPEAQTVPGQVQPEPAVAEEVLTFSGLYAILDRATFESRVREGCRGVLVLPSADLVSPWEFAMAGKRRTAWQGGVFRGRIEFPPDYPATRPVVRFMPPIFHPNVHVSTGNVDLDAVLGRAWNQWNDAVRLTLFMTLMALSLPEVDSPFGQANEEAGRCYVDDRRGFHARVMAMARERSAPGMMAA